MAPAAARSTILLLAVVLYSTTQQPFVSGQVLQKLNGEWHDISSGFANFVAGLNQQLLQDVQQPANGDDDGTTTATPSSLPPINLTVTFDQGNHVNLEAVPGGREFNAMQASAEAYLNDVSQELAAGDVSGAVLDNLFAKHMRTPFDSFTTFISKYQSTMELFAGREGVYEGGAGMGFGVNVLDCQGRPVLSMGAGIGFGFAATTSPESIYANISSGIGGGGGMTVLSYKSGGPEVVLNIGGGGGGGFCGLGSLTPNYGSSNDPNQTTIDLSSAYQTVALACTPLTISGSGGGGGGFVANDGPSTWADMNYGAGNQFSFGAAYSTGSTPSTSSGGTGDGQAIGKVYSSCRSSCQSQVTPSSPPNSFYPCFCPCTKRGLQALHVSWAGQITCGNAQQ